MPDCTTRKWTNAERATLRRGMKVLRKTLLLPCEGWPRDARAWARRDRIDTLLIVIETDPPVATKEDPARFLRTIEELREWVTRERDFQCAYPIFDVPNDWSRRELSPKTWAKIGRQWGCSTPPRRR